MKTVCFIRHAKSSWEQAGLSDIDRPLNLRGKTTAPIMAKILQEKGLIPDLIITSPAKRARQTAKAFRKEYGLNKSDTQFEASIYGGDEQTIFDILRKIDNSVTTVFVFGHNPTMNYLAALFSEDHIHVPTCGVLVVKLNIADWKSLQPDHKGLHEFIYPKQYIPEEGED